MENSESQHFNSEWKQAFAGAEAQPSNRVWANIDAQLLILENAGMKKRVIFYQRLAAASVGVLFLVSGYAFWGGNGLENSLAENKMVNGQVTEESNLKASENGNTNAIQENNTETLKVSGTENTLKSSGNIQSTNPVAVAQDLNESTKTSMLTPTIFAEPIVANQNQIATVNPSNQTHRNIPLNDDLNLAFGPRKLNPAMPKSVKPNDLSIAYRLADARPAIIAKKRRDRVEENTWASLGFAAGNFTNAASNLNLMAADANINTNTPPQMFTTTNTTKTEKTKPGSIFSMSLGAGKRVAKRWILQGGLSYLNQSSNSDASTLSVAPANTLREDKFGAAYAPENSNSVTYTTESEIKSTFQFISIPMQAGYLLLDRKFGVQVNGGLAPDVFIRSAVSDAATGTESVTTTGSSSAFRALSVSGIGGLEFSYGFSEHYRVSLTPGIRYALTPVYKENMLASAKPFMADIGLKFRYVFN
jgi:hypothetical protein